MNNYVFIRNLIGLQGIEVVDTNVNNGIFEVYTKSMLEFTLYQCCEYINYDVHDTSCPYNFITKKLDFEKCPKFSMKTVSEREHNAPHLKAYLSQPN